MNVDYENLERDLMTGMFREMLKQELIAGFRQIQATGERLPLASHYASQIAEIVSRGAATPLRPEIAFELYQEIVPAALLTLEQVISLVFAVSEGVRCSLDHCARCRALILIDHLSVARRVCAHCPEEERGGSEEFLQVAEPVAPLEGSEWQPLQRSLFELDDHLALPSTPEPP